MSKPLRSTGPSLATTPKPLQHHSTLVRKRESINDPVPSSPEKRAKVSFDAKVEVRVMGEWGEGPGLIQEEVHRALEKHRSGDMSGYLEIKEIYSNKKKAEDEASTTTLRHYTAALLNKVSLLNKSCSDLVYAVLNSEWVDKQEDYVALYVRFLGNLVSAQGIYLADTLHMLVDNLTIASSPAGKHSNSERITRSRLYARAHKALRYLLQLIPSASSILPPILTNAFPHESDSNRAHFTYVRNLLRLLAYAPELQAEVLALITERLVKIDVQVQVDLEDLAEEVEDGFLKDIPKIKDSFDEDREDSDGSDSESVASDESMDTEAQRAKGITRNVEKMDVILDMLFGHYAQMVSKASTDGHFGALDILLSQFVTVILPTHRSRHTQFLLFHFAQLSVPFTDTFVGTCVQMSFDKIQPAIVRQSAAAYLASFVARGMHVPSNIVRDVFDFIGIELERLRRDYEPSCRGPDLRRYSSFYSLVQAVLYIFCFRWRDLEIVTDDDSEDEDMPAMYGEERRWKSGVKEVLSLNIFSKLNPLKVCSPAIVSEFARVANHLGVIYVFHILETNKRIRLPQFSGAAHSGNPYSHLERETALSGRRDESHQHLDEYFPFDPYHLPKSKRWIEGDYREWTGIPGLDDDVAVESESDEDEAEAGVNENDDGTATDETGESD